MRAQVIAANGRPRQGILAFPRLRRKPGWAARPVKTARLGKAEAPVTGEEPPGRDLINRGLDCGTVGLRHFGTAAPSLQPLRHRRGR